jgi:hypothetical protein
MVKNDKLLLKYVFKELKRNIKMVNVSCNDIINNIINNKNINPLGVV